MEVEDLLLLKVLIIDFNVWYQRVYAEKKHVFKDIKKYELTSLKTLCMRNIVKNVPNYWVKQQTTGDIGPFEYLPTQLLEQLAALCKTHYQYDAFFEFSKLFITQNSVKISLGGVYTDAKDGPNELLEMVVGKCKRLTDLSIDSFDPIESSTLIVHLQNLVNLQFLDVSYTSFGDVNMKTIAAKIPRLRTLIVSETKVTDVGLSYLCESNCKSLENIILHQINATQFGILKLLESFPNLITVEHGELHHALLLFGKKYSGRKLKLKHIQIVQVNCSGLFEMCPDLQKISIFKSKKKNKVSRKSFDNFDNLPKLVNLKMSSFIPWFGSNTVRTISLENCEIDILDILLKFPNLVNLSVENCGFVCNSGKLFNRNKHVTKKLKVLRINGCLNNNDENCDLDSCALFSSIIGSKNLESLTIYGDPFHSNLIPALCFRTYFKHLKTNAVESDKIERIIQFSPNIESIVIEHVHLSFTTKMYNTMNSSIRARISGKTLKLKNNHREISIFNKYDRFVRDEISHKLQIKYVKEDAANDA